jgi:hypothetical protein
MAALFEADGVFEVTRLKKFPAELVQLISIFDDDSPSDFLMFWSFVVDVEDVVAIMTVGAIVVADDAEDSI